MKRTIIILLLLSACGGKDFEPDAEGNITGRITDKFINHTYERELPTLEISNGHSGCMGTWQRHFCYVSREEYEKHELGEIYTCRYK